MLLAEWLWTTLERDRPHALGAINPHNDDIVKKFGDQGGY